VWRLTVQVDSPGDRPQKELGDKTRELVPGNWQRKGSRQAVWNQVPPSDARGALGDFGAKLVHEEDFYTTLDDVHDTMLWLGAQLRVYLVLG